MPMDNRTRSKLPPIQDPSFTYEELLPASLVAEELLEDLSDAEINAIFGEGFNALEVILALSAVSTDFDEQMRPESPDEFSVIEEWEGERGAFHRREIYRMSYQFLVRFVKTIEVVLNGQLQPLHFHQPVTAMWYVHGAAKQHILDIIPFSPPDLKAKAFIKMCCAAHAESKLIRDLSKFSVAPARMQKIARRYLPDAAHRPFQAFFANDARHMQNLLRAALYLGLALAAHSGFFLVPYVSEDADRVPKHTSKFRSPLTERVADTMSALYLASTCLWSALTVCIKIPLKYNSRRESGKTSRQAAVLALCAVVLDLPILWRLTLLACCGMAFFGRFGWMYAFLIMDFFCQSSVLATILSAIKMPAKPLVMTFMGSAIVTFVYAAMGFHYFRQEFGDYCNENISACTQNILFQGMHAGIVGVSGMLTQVSPGDAKWFQRMAFDMSYFVGFGVILLSTIVALIVDSFSALRAQAEARESNLETQTFISCIDREKIDKVAQTKGITDGFEYHETVQQPRWDYMAFIFHMREKSVQDYTGPEEEIGGYMDREDVKWLPLGRSMLLEMHSDDALQEDVMGRVEEKLRKVAIKVDAAKDQQTSLIREVTKLDKTLKERLAELVEGVAQLQIELRKR